MPHDRLHGFRVSAGHRNPRPARVAQTVKVQPLAVVVRFGEEVAFFALAVFVRVARRVFKPRLPGRV
ncbi:MAG: hypothetical protein WD468_06510 [Pirellulales bacterium]